MATSTENNVLSEGALIDANAKHSPTTATTATTATATEITTVSTKITTATATATERPKKRVKFDNSVQDYTRDEAHAHTHSNTGGNYSNLNSQLNGVEGDTDQASASIAAGQIIDALTADFTLHADVPKEDEDADAKAKRLARKRRLCSVCGESARYTCPGCGVLSCSLVCVTKHKQVNECTGIRVKTSYVSLNSFTDAHLASDYQFLEDVHKMTGRAAREAQFRPRAGRNLPRKLQMLLKHAKLRGTEVRIMANGMKKRVCNGSHYNMKHDTIYWRLEWLFDAPVLDTRVTLKTPVSESKVDDGSNVLNEVTSAESVGQVDARPESDTNNGIEIKTESVVNAEETGTLEDKPSTTRVVYTGIDESVSDCVSNIRELLINQISALKTVRNQATRNALVDSYAAVDVDQLLVCAKVNERASNSVRYHRLQLDTTLKEALKGISLVEFPSLIVVLPEQQSEYNILGEVQTGESESESESESDSEPDSDSESDSDSENEGCVQDSNRM